MGGEDFGDRVRRHGAYHRCRTDEYLHVALCKIETPEANHRLRKIARTAAIRAGALSRGPDGRTGGVPRGSSCEQRPRRCRRRAGGGRCGGYVPYGVGMRPTQRDGHRRGALRSAAGVAAARYVRQEPHIQDGWRGWLRLRRDTPPDRGGRDRHHAAYHAPIFARPHRRDI